MHASITDSTHRDNPGVTEERISVSRPGTALQYKYVLSAEHLTPCSQSGQRALLAQVPLGRGWMGRDPSLFFFFCFSDIPATEEASFKLGLCLELIVQGLQLLLVVRLADVEQDLLLLESSQQRL